MGQADLKWRGCGEGSYVSHDGLFLISQVMVPGKKGPKKAWALYGRVLEKDPADVLNQAPWSWGDEPLTVWPQKKLCQDWAAGCDYEPAIRVRRSIEAEDRGKARGWSDCVECGVHFDRGEKHKTGDYCGINCVETVAERLMEIQERVAIHTIDGVPLRVGPARANEPAFRPRRRGA